MSNNQDNYLLYWRYKAPVDNKTYKSEVNKVKIFKNQSIESNIKKLNTLKK